MTKERFLIVTTMKNEAPFMLEWIAHNRSIGYDDFLIYTNDCSDGTDLIAERLDSLGIVSHVDNNNRKIGKNRAELSPQRAALRLAPRHERYRAADWVICADVDEFLHLRNGETLADLIAQSGPADAISLCWRLFGNGCRQHFEDIPVTEQFFCCAPETGFTNYRGTGLKTLYRNNGAFHRMGVHRPVVKAGRAADPENPFKDIIWRDAGGNIGDPSQMGWRAWAGFSNQFARLYHYAIRSSDSFLVKRDRGRTNHVNRDQGLEYFTAMNANPVRDYSMLKHVPGMLRELAKLKSDPVLVELHNDAVAWHRARISDIKSRPDWHEFILEVYAHRGGMM